MSRHTRPQYHCTTLLSVLDPAYERGMLHHGYCTTPVLTRDIALPGLLFHCLLSPPIAAPHVHGLVRSEPDDRAQRVLLPYQPRTPWPVLIYPVVLLPGAEAGSGGSGVPR
eukprot:518083-Rhodomonas_salina.3